MTEELASRWDYIIVGPLERADAIAGRIGGTTLLYISSAVPERNHKAVRYYLENALSLEDGEAAAVAIPVSQAITMSTYEMRTPTLRRRLRSVVWGWSPAAVRVPARLRPAPLATGHRAARALRPSTGAGRGRPLREAGRHRQGGRHGPCFPGFGPVASCLPGNSSGVTECRPRSEKSVADRRTLPLSSRPVTRPPRAGRPG